MFRLPLRGLDLYRTRGQAATVVNLRRRLTRSEAAKQEAESQTNQRQTRLPRNQATNLTDGQDRTGRDGTQQDVTGRDGTDKTDI